MRIGRRTTAVAGVVLCALLAPAGQAAAQEAPVSYVVNEAELPFAASETFPAEFVTERRWGVLNGAGFRMEVPPNWNGDLVTYSHGFVTPLQAELETPIPPLRDYFLSQGFAWASSSYSENGYAIEAGIRDTQALIGKFAELFEPADRLYATGYSLGGHVIGAMIEQFPDTYDGALPMCGVMGDKELFDYFRGHAAAAQGLAGVDASIPPPADYLSAVVPAIQAELGYGPGLTLDGEGHQLAALTEQLTGGERPLFDQAFEYWSDTAAREGLPFLLAVYGGALSGGPASTAYDFATNTEQRYQLDDDPALSPAEEQLNALVPRVAQTGEPPFPVIEGTLGNDTKVLTLHTIGDLFVPFSMQQIYLQEAIANGVDDRLVQRAIRAVAHCNFTPEETVRAFADLVTWVEDGTKPAGDDILDPEVVADRDFGCAFTAGEHAGIPECGTAPRLERLGGADRITTAAALVAANYEKADTVVLARADEYADALAAAPLAASLDAPVLLTRSGSLPAVVAEQIEALGATRAVVLGGEQAISAGVVAQLTEAGVTVERIGGATRYETAALVADELDADAAFVVRGGTSDAQRGWPDAVAVSALAAYLQQPILLVEQDAVPAATAAAIESLGINDLTVVGGPDAVSAGVVSTLEAAVADVTRVAGADRYGTSAAVAALAIQYGMEANLTYLATGTAFADALVAGPVAAADGSLLLLVDGNAATTEPTLALLAERKDVVGDVVLVGGPAAISTEVQTAVQAALARAAQ